MPNDEPEIFELLRKIRYDATAIQAKVSDALTMLAEMNLPDPKPKPTCPRCGVRLVHSLEEHIANVHDDAYAEAR